MPRRLRLDAELVRRGLARSRESAAEAVLAGRVRVGGLVASKPATSVTAEASIVVADPQAGPDPGWASRGAHKLLGALDELARQGQPVAVEGARCLDAGASTGGFTDVLLRAGAAGVVCVDVGYGQLVWRLRTDPRVTVLDRTNVRQLTPEQVGGVVDVTVADLSFISLRLVLPALVTCTRAGGHLLVLVKPQFEVGRERLGAGGVVREPELRLESVLRVAAGAKELGAPAVGVAASPLPGPAGNREFVLHLERGAVTTMTEQRAREVVLAT